MSWGHALQTHAVMSTQVGPEEDIKLVLRVLRNNAVVKQHNKLAYQ